MIKTTRLLQIPVTLRVVEEYIQTNDFREDSFIFKTFILIHTPEFLLLRLFASSSASLMLLVDGCWMCLQSH